MHRIVRVSLLLAALSLVSAAGSAIGGDAASAQTPLYPYGYPMVYPMSPYGYPMSYPMNPYGGMIYPMPVQRPATMPVAYPLQPSTSSTLPAVTAPTASAPQAASSVRIVDLAFSPPTVTIAVGDSVSWANTGMLSHTTSSDSGLWNSGTLAPGASFSHAFTAAGTFTYHCMIHPTIMMGSITVTASSATTPSPAGGPSVSYSAGWNLVGGPTGTVVTGSNGPLYTFRAGDTSYQTLSPGTPLAGGSGYWAYFNASATVALAAGGTQPGPVQLPAGRFVMVGNPGTAPVVVTGADTVLTYDAARGYQPTTTLQPGQGAWAYSNSGATLTMAASPA